MAIVCCTADQETHATDRPRTPPRAVFVLEAVAQRVGPVVLWPVRPGAAARLRPLLAGRPRTDRHHDAGVAQPSSLLLGVFGLSPACWRERHRAAIARRLKRSNPSICDKALLRRRKPMSAPQWRVASADDQTMEAALPDDCSQPTSEFVLEPGRSRTPGQPQRPLRRPSAHDRTAPGRGDRQPRQHLPRSTARPAVGKARETAARRCGATPPRKRSTEPAIHLRLDRDRRRATSPPTDIEPQEVAIRVKRGTIRGRGTNQAEATCTRSPRHDINFGIGPAGTGKTYLAVAKRRARRCNASAVQPHHPDAPGGRGGRAAGLPARRR